MDIAKKLLLNDKEIKLDTSTIAYKDLEGIARMLGWGIIIEEGSNENGEYVRWGNGFQVCWQVEITLNAISQNYAGAEWIYPKRFLSKPALIPNLSTSASVWSTSSFRDKVSAVGFINNTSSSAELRVFFSENIPNDLEVGRVVVVVIGRWK